MDNKWYVYRHRRLDNNEVFYVGIGKTNNFKRAYSKTNRNTYWKNIAKSGYSIEVLQEKLTKEEACELEIFLISIYGRKDLKKGSLVNLTNGGDGTANIIVSEATRKKQSEQRLGEKNSFYGRKHSPENITLMRLSSTGNIPTEEARNNMRKARFNYLNSGKVVRKSNKWGLNPNAKLVLDTQTGIFYETAKEAAIAIDIPYTRLKSYLGNYRPNKTSLMYC